MKLLSRYLNQKICLTKLVSIQWLNKLQGTIKFIESGEQATNLFIAMLISKA